MQATLVPEYSTRGFILKGSFIFFDLHDTISNVVPEQECDNPVEPH